MRIGIFGGSFDPVHLGHLVVAEVAAERLGLARVHFIPAGQQPFKVGAHAASIADRVAMLELAIGDNPRFVLDRREADRDGPSYTIDTLRSLHAEFPADELFLLVGADAAARLAEWREAETLRKLAVVAVLSRPGVARGPDGPGSLSVEVPAIDVSASAVRDAVARGESIRYRVPAAVAEYIAGHRLYSPGDPC